MLVAVVAREQLVALQVMDGESWAQVPGKVRCACALTELSSPLITLA